MRPHPFLPLLLLALAFIRPVSAQDSLADLLAAPDVRLSRPEDRARVVATMAAIEGQRRQNARARALQLGLPLRRVLPNGRIQEIAAFENDRPLYLTTHNAAAAISSGANLLHTSPYSLTGGGVTVGVWDGGTGRASHQEFGGRLVTKENPFVTGDHATHVCGTIAAFGKVAAARGMAGSATIDSYDWNSDTSEMTSRAATYAGEAGKIYLSNHSYGYIGGWNYVNGGSPTRVWEWNGSGSTATSIENDFGVYNTYARDTDSLAFNAPYYLIFRSAGNDRTENPATGQKVALSSGSSTVVNYDPAIHPAGDGNYRGGFDTIGFNAIAKNVMTVGSATDAVINGFRDPEAAIVSNFSSWGPTDDGRIKPDLVANGDTVYSPLNGSDTSYGTYSGTSMATPNAVGSAALLIQQFSNYFPGQAMRASTLKSLLIHTADDRGHPGPDYKYGWGMLNVKAAADVIRTAHDSPEKLSIIEDQLTTSITTRTYSFPWDGVSPLRATLGWTDPAASATNTSDFRTARLVNNLNLKILAPGGAPYSPFVMPFVGTWTQASMDLPATTGTNNTDNTEQIYLAAPPAAGVYQVVVSYSGTLTNSNQRFSLILTGTAPSGPVPPSLVAITPDATEPGPVALTITGSNFTSGSTVKFTMPGQSDVFADVTSITTGSIGCSLDAAEMLPGLWTVTVTNSSNQSGSLPSAFAVIGTIWSENFDTGSSTWSASASTGTSNWEPVTTQSHTPAIAWFASGPASKNTDNLVSEPIQIPANTSRLKLSFWHKYNLGSGSDCGVLEFSIDGGSWFYVGNTGSAEAITTGSYPLLMPNPGGNPNNRNEFVGKYAWSGNSGTAFTEVAVSLSDTAKYGGKSLRARWRLGTNSSTSSPGGWFIDSLKLAGAGGPINQAPTTVTAASATPAPVTGDTASLSFAADDDAGEQNLIYTWSVTGGTFERPVTLSENGSNAAKMTTATFSVAGNYAFQVVARDAAGATTSSSVAVTVLQTPSQVVVSPANASVIFGENLSFTATVTDQFSDPILSPALTWSSTGGGPISSAGQFIAQAAGGPFEITATTDGATGSASLTVEKATTGVVLANLSQPFDGSPKSVSVTTDPPDLFVAITYDGSIDPPAAAGTYEVVATITDPNYLGSATGSLEIAPASATVTLADLSKSYDGTPKPISATTDPPDLSVAITYDGSIDPPAAAGTYEVVATITDPNYLGSATGSLEIARASATVTLAGLSQSYDGTPKPISATTDPPDLFVAITYDGSIDPPAAAGTYEVVATITDPNYLGSATGSLEIARAPATVTLAGRSQSYDGTPQPISATTDPSDLSVAITYDGSIDPPAAAGTYEVVATVNDPNYLGSVTGSLEIARAPATVALTGLSQTYDGTPKQVSATTDPPDLSIAISYDGSTDPPAAVGTYEVIVTITDPNYLGGATGNLVIAAGDDWAAWQIEKFTEAEILAGLAADQADPDVDGLSNLGEFALGTDPHAFTAMPAAVLDDSGLSLTFTRPSALPGITYHAEFTDDFTDWSPLTLETVGQGPPETVRATVPPGAPGAFIRLRFVRE